MPQKSPEATPEGNTVDKIGPEVVLNPLPEKEDTPSSENETDRGDLDLKDDFSDREGEREEEQEEEEDVSSGEVSTTMPSPVQGAN